MTVLINESSICSMEGNNKKINLLSSMDWYIANKFHSNFDNMQLHFEPANLSLDVEATQLRTSATSSEPYPRSSCLCYWKENLSFLQYINYMVVTEDVGAEMHNCILSMALVIYSTLRILCKYSVGNERLEVMWVYNVWGWCKKSNISLETSF